MRIMKTLALAAFASAAYAAIAAVPADEDKSTVVEILERDNPDTYRFGCPWNQTCHPACSSSQVCCCFYGEAFCVREIAQCPHFDEPKALVQHCAATTASADISSTSLDSKIPMATNPRPFTGTSCNISISSSSNVTINATDRKAHFLPDRLKGQKTTSESDKHRNGVVLAVATTKTVIQTLTLTIVETPMVTVYQTVGPTKKHHHPDVGKVKVDEKAMSARELLQAKRDKDTTQFGLLTTHLTITAPASGTTTVFITGPTPYKRTGMIYSTIFPPYMSAMASMSAMPSTITSGSVAIVHTQTTVLATVKPSQSASSSQTSERSVASGLTTITNALIPEITTVRNISAPSTSSVIHTAIDTHSYPDISTFVATGLTIHNTESSSVSFSASFSRTISASSYSTASQTGKTTTAIDTADTGGFTGAIKSDVGRQSSKAVVIDSGHGVALMGAAIGACLALAVLL